VLNIPAWQKTTLENQFEKYFVVKEPDWHRYKIREYHVTSVGCDNSALEKNDHYGPNLRDTFYDYVNPLPDTIYSKGNKEMGRILHGVAQERYRKNNPLSLDEFPLQKLVYNELTNRNILLLGSIDIKDQYRLQLDGKPNEPIKVKIIDFKTASEYTLPKDDDDRNPTYLGQLRIYAYWLQNFYLNNKYIKVVSIEIVYIDKHNCGCYEIEEYDEEKCELAWLQFVHRAKKLDYHLYCFQLSEKYAEKNGKDDKYYQLLKKALPKNEPHKWTKYSKYKKRNNADVIFDEDIPDLSDNQIVKLFEKETGKNAVWNGKETKNFIKWKESNDY